jgi:hypothetical protein
MLLQSGKMRIHKGGRKKKIGKEIEELAER